VEYWPQFHCSIIPIGAKPLTCSLIFKLQVEASLADTEGLLEEVAISAFMKNDQPGGFKINNIANGSVLAKMGLRNGHIISGLNDQEITSPDQAAEFFQTLADGGDITIKVRKGKGVRKRSQFIRLNIE